MKNWVTKGRTLLDALKEHPTTRIHSSDARKKFSEVIESSDIHNYIVQHYNKPQAVICNIEVFEAYRQIALLFFDLVAEEEAKDRPEVTEFEGATVSREDWNQYISEVGKVGGEENPHRRKRRKAALQA